MAASIRKLCCENISMFNCKLLQKQFISHNNCNREFRRLYSSGPLRNVCRSRFFRYSASFLGIAAGFGVALKLSLPSVYSEAEIKLESLAKYKPVRNVRYPGDSSGLKIKLFQFQSCPFCCKLRAFLDYKGISYEVIEVNSVLKTEIKWSDYKKVPIVVAEIPVQDGKNNFIQLNDSSVIISILSTYLLDKNRPLEELKSFYPLVDSDDTRGKTKKEYQNRYFIMYGENLIPLNPDEEKKERKWRRWVDTDLVHVISPNIYRTPKEAKQAFDHFSEWGEWEKCFSQPMRLLVVYTGASVMYLISKLLKKRYSLKDDVRESLYDYVGDFTSAIGRKKMFMGGSEPNLADLSVYGVMSSMEGCDAFNDLTKHNAKFQTWYFATKSSVNSHAGLKNNQPKN